jgi:hypothetical protein
MVCQGAQAVLESLERCQRTRVGLLMREGLKMMDAERERAAGRRTWVSVHECAQCHQVVDLAALDLGAVTSGIATCPYCEWAGKIEIRVVEAERIQL